MSGRHSRDGTARPARSLLRAALSLALVIPLSALSPSAVRAAEDESVLEARRAETETEYRRISEAMTLSEKRLAELAAEIAAVRKDDAAVTAALVQAAKTERKLADDVAAIEQRMDGLKEQEASIRLSLQARRAVLAEVLGALQRMGLNPPPAILVRPEDALASVRSAIVLGAVVPELRTETEILLSDIRELASLRAAIMEERERLLATIREQADEKQRLSLLLDEKRKLLARNESFAEAERRRTEELAARAGTLKELITALEGEIDAVRKAADAARQAEEERARREAEAAGRPIPEQNRLEAGISFETMKKQVALPVSGRFIRHFGEPDAIGSRMLGDTVQTQSGSIVTSPADGVVLYAGPFRSYGQLLILDAGDGYHVVLAGMDRINVALGQSVLAGEPLGTMGEARLASVMAFGSTEDSPELYIEFRKDGKPVDPSPWWAERSSGRTGNGT
ncbi:murein hydrolase activator EnvC family protein [Aquibium microcysteis]|uniref:murein hydrolase activator EnvC family protein n=1 Tax=Aquibium microcysteis TaxID=675281 RepID=UPI00165D294C|nr:murein hydrolase activator EnvC [Aquibium microcysteis]